MTVIMSESKFDDPRFGRDPYEPPFATPREIREENRLRNLQTDDFAQEDALEYSPIEIPPKFDPEDRIVIWGIFIGAGILGGLALLGWL